MVVIMYMIASMLYTDITQVVSTCQVKGSTAPNHAYVMQTLQDKDLPESCRADL